MMKYLSSGIVIVLLCTIGIVFGNHYTAKCAPPEQPVLDCRTNCMIEYDDAADDCAEDYEFWCEVCELILDPDDRQECYEEAADGLEWCMHVAGGIFRRCIADCPDVAK